MLLIPPTTAPLLQPLLTLTIKLATCHYHWPQELVALDSDGQQRQGCSRGVRCTEQGGPGIRLFASPALPTCQCSDPDAEL